ncbi:hypothetical protein HK16_06430 [Acetobacter senegalensis]|uniref:Uncharacterized protein n=1 Tax=Acetobacter senegalensis TaxID=446692 RepID=A0A252EL42_9PROT|nr:hypothetical protein HK16_06430 [Acetobacter senegalensis]
MAWRFAFLWQLDWLLWRRLWRVRAVVVGREAAVFMVAAPVGEDSVAVAAWGPVAVLEAAVWAVVFAPVVPALVVRGVAAFAVARALAAQEDFTAAAWAGAAVGAVAPDGAGVAEAGATPIIAGVGVIPVGAGVLAPMAAGAGALRLSSAQHSGWR